MAFDIAYQQRTAHMSQASLHGCSSSSIVTSQNGSDNSNSFSGKNDVIVSTNGKSLSERRDLDEREAHLGEKVAVGAQAVSDAVMQLRCHAMKRQLDIEIGPERYADLSKVKEKEKGELDFNSLSNSSNQKSNTGASNDSGSQYDAKDASSSWKYEKESQEEQTVLCEILKEQLPALPSECNDSGSPSLDLILSVLSTDSLTRGVGAMGMPQTYSYKKEFPSVADKEKEKIGDEKEVERDGIEVPHYITCCSRMLLN